MSTIKYESSYKFEFLNCFTGLLGKGLSRQANRIWNYGLVGGLGTILLLLIFPLVALLTSVLSITAAIMVPLWMPVVTFGVHVTNMLVYDMDCPDPGRINRLVSFCEKKKNIVQPDNFFCYVYY